MQKNTSKWLTPPLVFLLTALLLGAVLLLGVKSTVLNKSFYLSKVDSADYSENLYQDFLDEVTALAIPGGIPQETMKAAVDYETFDREITTQIEMNFAREDYVVQSNSVYESFMGTFVGYAQEQGIKLDDAQRKDLEHLAEQCTNVYIRTADFPFIAQISAFAARFNGIFWILLAILLIAIALVGVAMWFMQHWRHRAVRYYMYALLASGMTSLIFPLILFLAKPYKNFSIEPAGLRLLLVELCDGVLLYLMGAAIVLAVMAALCHPLYKKLRHTRHKA